MYYVIKMGWSAPVIVTKMDKTSSAAIETLFEGAMYSSGWDGVEYLAYRDRKDVSVEVVSDDIIIERIRAGDDWLKKMAEEKAKAAEEKAAAEIVAAAEAKLAELDSVEAA